MPETQSSWFPGSFGRVTFLKHSRISGCHVKSKLERSLSIQSDFLFLVNENILGKCSAVARLRPFKNFTGCRSTNAPSVPIDHYLEFRKTNSMA
ncbi:hypothetical protein NPIL_557531 [Nephila pilipes]|uniref:Uncharacterized protein n=1 Tax=Nephila pilipes TaxID=299642 RepID=A0A8X6Q5D8_NEPPI|nr:hypothetical protein NPIL_557531 [Nephila pilipes]